jgi:hypothetical protein
MNYLLKNNFTTHKYNDFKTIADTFMDLTIFMSHKLSSTNRKLGYWCGS